MHGETSWRLHSLACVYTVSQKICQCSFCSVSVGLRYEPISIKFGRHVQEYTLNKNMHTIPTSPKICASTTLGNLKWQIERQRSTLNSHKATGSYCLKLHQTYSKSHHLYIIYSKCLPPVRTKILDVDELKRRIKKSNEQIWITYWTYCWRSGASVCSHWRRTFQACDVKITWLHVWRFARQ